MYWRLSIHFYFILGIGISFANASSFHHEPRFFRYGPDAHKSKATIAREELERLIQEKGSSKKLDEGSNSQMADYQGPANKPPSFDRPIDMSRSVPMNKTSQQVLHHNNLWKLSRSSQLSQPVIDALVLRHELMEMKRKYSRYLNITINQTLVALYKQHHQPKPLGRGIAPVKQNSTDEPKSDGKPGDTLFDNMDENQENMQQRAATAAPPVREWGDECNPPLLDIEEDECYEYTKHKYGDDNSRLLSCDYGDRICLCTMDEKYVRAEYSKELEICLVPEYYRCNVTSQCAPLLVCAKATPRDYENEPDIPPGFPKICRKKLHVPPNISSRMKGGVLRLMVVVTWFSTDIGLWSCYK